LGLIDEVPDGARIALDTSALIYYIEEHTRFGPIIDPLFLAIADGRNAAFVSVVSFAETLVAPFRAGRVDLADRYRLLLTSTDNLNLVPVTRALAEEAARIRASHKLRLPDALIAATAAVERCSKLIANDRRFTTVPSFETVIISRFTDT